MEERTGSSSEFREVHQRDEEGQQPRLREHERTCGQFEITRGIEPPVLSETAILQQQMTAMLNLMTRMEENQNRNNNASYHVMPDLTKEISDFNGIVSEDNVREWLDRVNSCGLLHNWPEEFKLATARMHLTGAAKHWYEVHDAGKHH